MDTLSQQDRSENMRRIRGRDTSPEWEVRRLVHSMGFRYRLHVRELPGCPDLVFPRLRKIIFVHGCFWHPHGRCRFSHAPKSNMNYWIPKLESNRRRDKRNIAALRRLGWKVLIIRECETERTEKLSSKLQKFLSG